MDVGSYDHQRYLHVTAHVRGTVSDGDILKAIDRDAPAIVQSYLGAKCTGLPPTKAWTTLVPGRLSALALIRLLASARIEGHPEHFWNSK